MLMLQQEDLSGKVPQYRPSMLRERPEGDKRRHHLWRKKRLYESSLQKARNGDDTKSEGGDNTKSEARGEKIGIREQGLRIFYFCINFHIFDISIFSIYFYIFRVFNIFYIFRYISIYYWILLYISIYCYMFLYITT